MLEELQQELKRMKMLALGIACLVLGLTLFSVSVSAGGNIGQARLMLASLLETETPSTVPTNQTEEITSTSTPENLIETEGKEFFDPASEIAGSVRARAVHVYDVTSERVLFEVNSNQALPLASITKLMTALVAIEQRPGATTLVVEGQFLPANNPNILRVGDRWRLQDLIDMAMVQSSNDAATVIGHSIGSIQIGQPLDTENGLDLFVDLMNEKANELNLSHSSFFNPSGLDTNEIEAGAQGSARDVSLLMVYIAKEHPSVLEVTTKNQIERLSLNGTRNISNNTNQFVGHIPRLMGSKTGFTDIAGGNLTVMFEPRLGRPVVITVLGSSASSRFSDVLHITDVVNQYYEMFNWN